MNKEQLQEVLEIFRERIAYEAVNMTVEDLERAINSNSKHGYLVVHFGLEICKEDLKAHSKIRLHSK